MAEYERTKSHPPSKSSSRPKNCLTLSENADPLPVLKTRLHLYMKPKDSKILQKQQTRTQAATTRQTTKSWMLSTKSNKLETKRTPSLQDWVNSVRNIETNLVNHKARIAKLEEFEAMTKKDIAELKRSCSFNGDKCKEHRDELKKQIEGQTKRRTSLMENERKLANQRNDIISKNLYLNAFYRWEISIFSISQRSAKKFHGTRSWLSQRPVSLFKHALVWFYIIIYVFALPAFPSTPVDIAK